MTETRCGSQSVYYIILPQSPSSSPSPRRENLIAVDAHRPPPPDLCPSLTHSHLIDLLPVHHNNHFQRLPPAADLAREGGGVQSRRHSDHAPPPFALSSYLPLPPVPFPPPPMLTRKGVAVETAAFYSLARSSLFSSLLLLLLFFFIVFFFFLSFSSPTPIFF